MKTFGFDNALKSMDKVIKAGETAKEVAEDYGEKAREKAIQIATSKGLKVTGKGIDGIVTEKTENGVNVGWADRPNFHLYFHEVGFHAVDNRRKQRIRRSSNKTGRVRDYSNVKATYIPPRSHMRPAADWVRVPFLNAMKKHIKGD